MKTILRNFLIYFIIGLLFTCGIVFFYDGNLYHYDIVLEGALLFAGITFVLERIMNFIYVRIKIPSVIRVIITISSGVGLYTVGVWLTKPWLLYKVFNLPVFVLAILPMFLIFAVAFEIYFVKRQNEINQKLKDIKRSSH